jgi:hypothetical protein
MARTLRLNGPNFGPWPGHTIQVDGIDMTLCLNGPNFGPWPGQRHLLKAFDIEVSTGLTSAPGLD